MSPSSSQSIDHSINISYNHGYIVYRVFPPLDNHMPFRTMCLFAPIQYSITASKVMSVITVYGRKVAPQAPIDIHLTFI